MVAIYLTCGILIVRSIIHGNRMAFYFFKKGGALKSSYKIIYKAQHWRSFTVITPGPQIILSTRCIALWGRMWGVIS
jgi:hypothetical protein